MDPKPDKECEKRGDIVLLFKIIKNSIYWQAIFIRNSIKYGFNFRAYHRLSYFLDTQFMCNRRIYVFLARNWSLLHRAVLK